MNSFPEDLTAETLLKKDSVYIAEHREKIYQYFQRTRYGPIKVPITSTYTQYVHKVITSELAGRNLTTEIIEIKHVNGVGSYLIISPMLDD